MKDIRIEEHIQRLDITRRYLLTSLQEMTVEQFHSIRSFPGYDVSSEWVIRHLIQHEAEHSGKILEIQVIAKGRFVITRGN